MRRSAVRCLAAHGASHIAVPETTMQRTMLKSKIHRASVTHCELHYEGSCAIDESLLEAANITENEQIDIWNISNGERLTTYAIRGERGSGMISLNGSAARRAQVGDLIIIAAFALIDDADVRSGFKPSLVFCDERNTIRSTRDHVPAQGWETR
ncbi:hypothetical protein DFQ28_009345 [Apophysomyces sp. BC1034]|nr:hypothetical protein DFQ30_010835 [Apophysomyces sp. BC1015]KAG0192392.1 hypothetical protein DFQ28_009345 [Apophysomyces sp. BC1034]